jgi:hypothetical protein
MRHLGKLITNSTLPQDGETALTLHFPFPPQCRALPAAM